jgi:hypothetical protein
MQFNQLRQNRILFDAQLILFSGSKILSSNRFLKSMKCGLRFAAPRFRKRAALDNLCLLLTLIMEKISEVDVCENFICNQWGAEYDLHTTVEQCLEGRDSMC